MTSDLSWTRTKVADHLILDGINVPDGSLNITVRALNANGYRSAERVIRGVVDHRKPTLSGALILLYSFIYGEFLASSIPHHAVLIINGKKQ